MATQVEGMSLAPAARTKAPEGYLFSPIVDFLCLGGSSLLLFPFMLLVPADEYKVSVAAAMLLVAHFINHPHFAHSYQIFYRNFAAKVSGTSLGRTMQLRYIFAGIVAPALLIAFCAYGIVTTDARLLGYGANLMALAVGWHYVKQGYGMLMVDAALKKRFFDDRTKKILLANCYAVWGAAWLNFNAAVSKNDLWGLQYYTFSIPQPIVVAAGMIAVATGTVTLFALAAIWKAKRTLPVNGVIAYVVSLYIWLLFVRVHPIWALVVPALHSLQYLLVVWRYQLNYASAQASQDSYPQHSLARQLLGPHPFRHFALFSAGGALLGFLGFWGLPIIAGATVPYDTAVLTGTLFLFVFWMVINVHHYLMDNVMWRRENPDTRRYLFG